LRGIISNRRTPAISRLKQRILDGLLRVEQILFLLEQGLLIERVELVEADLLYDEEEGSEQLKDFLL